MICHFDPLFADDLNKIINEIQNRFYVFLPQIFIESVINFLTEFHN